MNENKNLFSIGELSKAVGVTRRIILNYEDKGLIKPDVKDGVSGNRYYTIDTFTQIRTIRVFQDLGLSLDEIRAYFDGTTDLSPLIKRLEKLRDELNLSIEKLYERSNLKPKKIEIITIPAQKVYCRTYTSLSIEEKTNTLRDTALEAMHKYGTDITRRLYFTELYLDDMEKTSYCVAIPPESEGEFVELRPEFKALSIFHHGAYEDFPKVRETLLKYAEENNLKLQRIARHIFLEGPPQHKDPSKFITQIVIPLETQE